MNNLLLQILIISVIIGIVVSVIFVIFLKISRGKKQTISSLLDSRKLVGLFGTVQIPFDNQTKGKIRVNFQGSIIDLMARSNSAQQFLIGDEVFVIEAKNNEVWVIPKESLKQDWMQK
jgi:hypothetical protein